MSFLSRGLQKIIDSTEISNGKMRLAVDSARLFFDTANERIEITDFVKGLTYDEIMAIKSPLPKIYLSSDTYQLLLYDNKIGGWISYSGGGQSSETLEAKVAELEAKVRKLENMILLTNESE